MEPNVYIDPSDAMQAECMLEQDTEITTAFPCSGPPNHPLPCLLGIMFRTMRAAGRTRSAVTGVGERQTASSLPSPSCPELACASVRTCMRCVCVCMCVVVWCGAVECGVVWCGAVQCGAMRCGAMR